MRWFLVALFGLASAGADECDEAGKACASAGPVSFTTEQRQRIDEGALWGPREKRNVAQVEAYGSALKWLLARTPIPIEEEELRTARKAEELQSKFKTSEPPAAALEVFTKLVDSLPSPMRPKGREFTLTVADLPDADAFTPGVGRLYVSANFLKSALEDDCSGKDQLAFALAHELGHLALGHARRVYQRAWLNEQLKKDLAASKKTKDTDDPGQPRENKGAEPPDKERKREAARRILDDLAGVGMILEHVYTREEQFQADLFAIHLCRNAGFNLENCLDLLRGQAVKEDAALLEEHPPRVGIPPVISEVQPATSGEQLTLAGAPTAMQRLRRLRLELDGRIYGEEFGLFEFDSVKQSLRRAADRAAQDADRVIVCVHGMESNLKVYLPFMRRLAGNPSSSKFKILGFQYPNDESLARSGKFLRNEFERVGVPAKNVDFVCHSAGGLVVRHCVEVEGGAFHRIYFQGTPHRGSDLASLRALLEMTQFIGDINLGYDAALQKAILDGHGQISIDLTPESLFLTHLNAPRGNLSRDRYEIYRGQAASRARVVLLRGAVEAARAALERAIRNEGSTAARFGRAGIEKLVLPAEIVNGDMAVTLESATLDGVAAVYTHSLRHTELPHDSAVIEHLVKLLVSEK